MIGLGTRLCLPLRGGTVVPHPSAVSPPRALERYGNAPFNSLSRRFDAAYFYFLQNLGSVSHQLIVKYDWYDPNKDVAGENVRAGANHTAADVKFSTIGGGYLWYVNPNLKLVLYYDHPVNEQTAVASHADDLDDDTFTARLQFRF